MTVHRVGIYALIVGAVLTVAGLILGFGFLIAGGEGPTRSFLAMVPLGFLVGFLGIVMTLLGESGLQRLISGPIVVMAFVRCGS